MKTACKSCGAGIDFIKTLKGRTMPVNLPPILVLTDGGECIKGYVSHWATCPTASRHRAVKKAPAEP